MPRTLEEAEKLLREARDALEPYWFSGDHGDYNNDGVIETSQKIDKYFEEPSDVNARATDPINPLS